ncbi:hypothetical protein Misp01_00410 [Microtetraspora sp. NBRC 13810]|nr:hypothetical protein Misp01_00410 [Microtetraspora sp. NBRC 13810]
MHGEDYQAGAGGPIGSSWGDVGLVAGFAATVEACPWQEVRDRLGALIAETGDQMDVAASRVRDAEDAGSQAARRLQEEL